MAATGGQQGRSGAARLPVRLGVLLGARSSAWHCEVFAELPPDIAPTLVGTTRPRYPGFEPDLPLLRLPYEDERGSWLGRKLLHLRYRLQHRRTGFEFALDPAPGALSGFDVLLTWELFTEWTRVALDEKRRRGVPVGVVVWDNLGRHFAEDARRGPIRSRALAEADAFYVVTAHSEFALRLDGVPAARIGRGRPAVDVERFHPRTGPPDRALRARLGAADGDLLVLTVARLEEGKGVRFLLQALAGAAAHFPGLRLAVIGDGPLGGELAREASALGIASRTRFLSAVPYPQMPEIHRAADLFVLPSLPTPDWQEQWGQSLLEAMASGTAVLASRSGGIPELLDFAGPEALVAPGDAFELGQAMLDLARDPERRLGLGRRGREAAIERFGLEDEAARLAAFVRRLCPGEPPHA